jgi:tetratricopeptide (TPR) repeat protein
MDFRKFFSGRTPETHEIKGDALFQASAHGKAKVEYEKALSRLEKTSGRNDELKFRLQEKIRRTKEALAHDHKQTAANLIEAGYVDDAQQYIGLALELTADPQLKSELRQQLQDLDNYLAEEFPRSRPPVDRVSEEAEAVAEIAQPVFEVQEDEYFGALIGTLPEEVQAAYLSYGDFFQKGYLALNQGDFETAAEHLARAMQAHPDPQSYIPLELATALLNLGNSDKARPLLESFLKYHPDALPGYQLLCEIFWETQSFDQAEALLNSLPREMAESGAGCLLRGETLYRTGKFAQAKSLYRDFLKTYGWNEAVSRALAKTHEALGEMANARNLYKEIIDQCRSCHARIDPVIKQKYADLHFASGLYSTEILELYLALAREIPQNAADYYQKVSQIYATQGNEQEARRFRLIASKAKE